MKTRISSALLALALLATPSLAGGISPTRARTLPASDAARLRSLETAGLSELRGGAVAVSSSLPGTDRAELRAAQARSPELQALRAGDLHLTDHDLMIIGIIVGIVIIILLI